jgi:hypothetical protein
MEFVDAGPGPRQVTLTLNTDGSATESVSGVPRGAASTRFHVGSATVSALAGQLHRADLPALKLTYGLPNPAGAWTSVTARGRTVTVYCCASGPDGLQTLIGSLEPIATAHQPPTRA